MGRGGFVLHAPSGTAFPPRPWRVAGMKATAGPGPPPGTPQDGMAGAIK